MPTVSIIPALDPTEDRPARFVSRLEVISIQHLAFKGCEDAFGHGVVEAVADAAHRGSYTELCAARAEGDHRVLAAVIGVVDHIARSSLYVGHLQRLLHQFTSQPIGHRPPDDQTREHIEHDRQVQKALRRRHIGHIRNPQRVRPIGDEVPLHQIWRPALGCAAACGASESSLLHPFKTGSAHQPRHTLAAHPHAVTLTQLRVHAPGSIGVVRTLVAGMDQRGQVHSLAIMLGQQTIPPIVKTARGDLQQPAHRTHRKGVLVRSHESEEFIAFGAVSCATEAAAFARISRSNYSRLFSRRRRVSSTRSFVVRPPSPWPASRSACLTHNAIVQGVGPNSRASSGMPRPARCSSTICRRNSAVYRFEVFDLAIRDSCHANCKESVKAGPDHYPLKNMPDALELETFAKRVEATYVL